MNETDKELEKAKPALLGTVAIVSLAVVLGLLAIGFILWVVLTVLTWLV